MTRARKAAGAPVDRVWRARRTGHERSIKRWCDGEWTRMAGWWRAIVDGHAVAIIIGGGEGPQSGGWLYLEILWHGTLLRRSWDGSFTDRQIALRCRQFAADAVAGQVGLLE